MKKLLRYYSFAVLLTALCCLFASASYAQAPIITSVSPLKGPVGTLVTLTGSNFNLDKTKDIVFFGAVMAQVDHVVSNNVIVVVAPLGTDEQFISVTNLDTKLTSESAISFHLTYTNTGPISFNLANTQSIAVSGDNNDRPTMVVVKDIDGDGMVDLIVSVRDAEEIHIYRNVSSIGNVSFLQPIIISTPSPRNLVVADFTGDGLPDIACDNFTNGEVHLFRNTAASFNSPISFTPATYFSKPVGTFTSALAAADIDGDGKLDLVQMNWTTSAGVNNTFSVYRNTSTNGGLSMDFPKDFEIGTAADGLFNMDIGDFLGNLDGKPDLFINRYNSQVYIFARNISFPGTINFLNTSDVSSGYTTAIKLVDVNNDHLLDLVFGNTANQIIVKLNNANDTFATEDIYNSVPWSYDIATADFDGDGLTDISAVSNLNDKGFSVLKNGQGGNPGKFYSSKYFTTIGTSLGIAACDIDGDGKQDVLTYLDGTPKIYFELNSQTPPADVLTLSPANVTLTSVLFWGSVKANTSNVSVSFEYGTDPNLASFNTENATVNKNVNVGQGTLASSYNLTGNFSADMYYRVVATDASNNVYKGDIVKVVFPTTVVGITALSPNPNNGKTGSIVYKVEFSKIITGVDAANFAVTKTGGISVTSGITNVIQNFSQKKIWQVTVGLGPVTADGTVQLSLANSDNFSAGVTNTLPLAGETYTIAPEITLSTLPVTNITATGATLQGLVKSTAEDVTVGFDYGDSPFLIGAIHTNAFVNGTVTAGSGAKTAEFILSQVKPGEHFYRVTAKSATSSVINGETLNYYVPYTVKSIKAASPNPNTGKTGLLLYEVEFNGVVNNLTANNFTLATTGAVNATLSTIIKSGDPLKPNSWFVTVTIGTGEGTVNLQLKDVTGLNITLSTPLPFIGETYTIDKAPATPTGLIAEPGNGEVRISWNANTEPDFNGYKLYYGTTANSTTNETLISGSGQSIVSRTIYLLTNNQLYYFRLVAYDKANTESEFTGDVTATPMANLSLKDEQKINFNDIENKTFGDAPFYAETSSNSGLPITLKSSDPSIAAISGTQITILKAGTVTIYANSVGSGNWKDAPEVSKTFKISKQNVTVLAIKTVDPSLNANPNGFVRYRVDFSALVTGLQSSNFTLAGDLKNNASIEPVFLPVPGFPNSWYVDIAVDFNVSGTLQLNFDNSIGLPNSNIISVPVGETYTIDQTPPAVPIGLKAEAGDGEVRLTWNANMENDFNKYLIYVTSGGIQTPLAVVEKGIETYLQTGLTNGIEYSYVIYSRDFLGNTSGSSVVVKATPKAGNFLKKDQVINFPAITDKNINDADFALGASTNANLPVTYFVKGLDALTVDITSDNKVHIKKAGKVTIFANAFGNSEYNDALQVSQQLNISEKIIQTIGFGPLAGKYYRDADFNLSATATSGLTDITFSSSDENIATVTGNVVHILHAGTVIITAKQAGNDSYAAAQQTSTLTILPMVITVTADAKTKKVGQQDPDFTYTYTPKLIGNEEFIGSLTRQAGSTAGIYSILNNLLLSNDYTINYIGADLTITNKDDQIISFDPLTNRVYGGADFNLSASSNANLTNFTFKSSNPNVASVTGNVVHILHAGITTITATEAGDSNYETGQQDRTLNILPLAITVTADAQTKKVGEQDPDFTFTYAPKLINNENFEGGLSRQIGANEGVYAITQNNLSLSNDYKITYIGANLTITNKKDQTISFGPLANKVYGDADFDLGASSSFFGPVVTYTTSDDKVATIVNGKLHIVKAGEVMVYANHPGDQYVNAALQVIQPLVIKRMDVVIQPDAKVKALGEQDPLLTYQVIKGKLIGSDKFLGALERAAGESIGTYPITLGSLGLNDNYTLQLIGANLVIELKSFDGFIKDVTNILTPNGDGINDYFVVKYLSKYPPIAIVITDRLGRIMYKNEQYQNNWDGTYNGKKLATDTYYYYLDFGKGYSKVKGYITIVNPK